MELLEPQNIHVLWMSRGSSNPANKGTRLRFVAQGPKDLEDRPGG